jgi:mono/diheme cytochrome c family protein
MKVFRISSPKARFLPPMACALALLLPAAATAQRPPELAQNATAGAAVFGSKGCVVCHSVRGLGGREAPDLGEIPARHSFYDLGAALWNHIPRMAARFKQRSIPRVRLLPREAGDLFAFLYTLDYFDPPGDASEGERLFFDKKCVVCHQVKGVGGVVGPNLDFLGGYQSPIPVATAMWNHGPAMAEEMRARGVTRPSFTGRELRDLVKYLESASGAPPDESTFVLPGRAEVGRELFASKRCATCHGTAGQGGVGPRLAGRGSPEGLVEFAAAMWNKAPAMTREMRARGVPVPELEPSEMADIVAYLYSVGYFEAAGNPERGRAILREKGCVGCHVAGRVPPLEPARYSSDAAVFAAIWNHVGAPGVDEREWPSLSGADVAHLVSYLTISPR